MQQLCVSLLIMLFKLLIKMLALESVVRLSICNFVEITAQIFTPVLRFSTRSAMKTGCIY